MIALGRVGERPRCFGHRGAAALALENTIGSFRAGVAAGAEVIEFDVLDLTDGQLVVAHSGDLAEVTHGAASGRVRDMTFKQLRTVAPELPTLSEALAFFAEEATTVGIHIDLKLRTRLSEVARLIAGRGLGSRVVVSSPDTKSLHEIARHSPDARIALTYPNDRRAVSRRPVLAPVMEVSLRTLRALAPHRVPGKASRAGASAIMLHHRLVTASCVGRLQAEGRAVIAWTVDDPAELRRVDAAGVDGIITNDPKTFMATLGT